MDTHTIRTMFLDFFASKQHRVVRSASLVPEGDPTLYFTNAGMVQFKDVFTGQETREYRRATTSQKCLRVSGKHNDLESVGRTSRHHTFFEMLGNFSFGDYFKTEAIRFGWEFLTVIMGLDPTRLAGTVFGGEGPLPADEEAYRIWRDEIGLPETRIFRLGAKDNFWSMGDTGPCGPCSELHYLQGADLPCPEPRCLGVACECDRWVEVWNLVFMQFDRRPDGQLLPLKHTGVDTGMGLERLAAVKQGVLSTFETDLIRPIIDHVARMRGLRYGLDPQTDISLRVVADHARATAFCIADGVFPEKGGREYVLRRIMRRAIRHGKRLGFEEPFFHEACRLVISLMSSAYPELGQRGELIEALTRAEEASFRRTLGRGLAKLSTAVGQAQAEGRVDLPLEFVGDLYATDGFPIDLTRLIAEEHGLSVDESGAHDWVARTHGAAETRVGDEAVEGIYKALLERLGETRFLGYETLQAESEVLALLADRQEIPLALAGQTLAIICRQTPFYGRSGGQVGDTGQITWTDGHFKVLDTVKLLGGLHVHHGILEIGELRPGVTATLHVDEGRRRAIRSSHSATHLLHLALRQVLGPHVAQKGSEVSPGLLRFDFSHFQAMSPDEIARVEGLVNEEIQLNKESLTEVLPYEQARERGAMALFGEKYGDRVRVVHIGSQSLELCGGTHVSRSGDIGLFKVLSEEALALGVRRIVAATGSEALRRLQAQENQLRNAAMMLRTGPEQVGERIEKLLVQLKAQEREIADLKRTLAMGSSEGNPELIREKNGIRVLTKRVANADPKTLREAGDALRTRLGSGVVVLGGEVKDKAALLVMVSPDLIDRVHAGALVGALAQMLEGKGGGRPDMAQGGGPRIDRIDEALLHVIELV